MKTVNINEIGKAKAIKASVASTGVTKSGMSPRFLLAVNLYKLISK